jgi:hypothetical protein
MGRTPNAAVAREHELDVELLTHGVLLNESLELRPATGLELRLQAQLERGWGYLDFANRRLKSSRSGSYRTSVTRITWAGGPLAQLYGVVTAASKFEVWASGEQLASYTCYFKF